MICVATDITYDFKLFQHWWKYYRSLGISNFVVAVGDFIDPSLPVKFKKAYGSVDGIKIVPISERFKKTGFEGSRRQQDARTMERDRNPGRMSVIAGALDSLALGFVLKSATFEVIKQETINRERSCESAKSSVP